MDNKSNNITNESSINRIRQWIYSHDIAILTAFRDTFANATKNTLDDRPDELKKEDEKNGITNPSDKTPYTYTTSEKEDRNRDLHSTLLRLGYGVTKINGNYIEHYKKDNVREVSESSFFVVNLHDDTNFYNNIFKLSEYYNQDSFLYKAKNSDIAYLVGTNNSVDPGYNRKISAGKFHMNIDNQFLSRYGNKSFAFTDDDNPTHDNRTYNFNTRKNARINNQKNLNPIKLDEWSTLELMGKWAVSTTADRVISNIKQLRANVIYEKP